uniref:Ras-responsive element-binding protein 1 n=1 Tax=Xiphophorus couchianus TaxID=32473 RepID=A0A3B5KU52_9TELE
TLQNGERGGGGGDLSSINAMMSTVMSAAGTINGGGGGGGDEGGSGVTSANSSDSKDDGSAFICPLCDKNCQTQHQLTMHIRQHNADAGATDHSCSICGKCLSSASSLDRHMLVHSGERPYKCTVCGQTFTTNGNMHRHMKIHDKDPASGLVPLSSPPSPTKRRRPSVKRRQGLEDDPGDEPPAKKAGADESAALPGAEEELLPCPICFKTCSSRLDLDAHMDTHPDTLLRCDLCCLSFRTHRGLLRHNAAVHKLLPQDPSGHPFIQNNPSIPTGFNDLAFIDFSCKKFAHIAQVWCETNLRRCISKFHRFVCDSCDKAFPLRSALDLHKTASHPDRSAEEHQEAGKPPSEKAGVKAGSTGASAKGSFPCRFCDQVFAVSGALQAHMRFHLGILPHQCNMCDYVAPDKATLIRHLRTHSGERPYVCRMCHYPFTVKANCERHLRKKHAKTSRKDIEKNIKYVTFSSGAGITTATTTQEAETGCETTCRFCGEGLKTYRALQIHLRTHNGCQRKPFECRRCGAAFLAKRNCIHHLLKQHPEVQEREIEGHITTLLPSAADGAALNGLGAVKAEELLYPAELDQPLDFSAKGRGSRTASPAIKTENASHGFDSADPDQPIDLSIPSKRQRREAGDGTELKTEQSATVEQQLAASPEEKAAGAVLPVQAPPLTGCYQLPPAASRSQRLKPLLPKPSASSPPSVKDLAPLASIAQIISSVSAAQGMLDGAAQTAAPSSQHDTEASGPAAPDPPSDDVSDGSSRYFPSFCRTAPPSAASDSSSPHRRRARKKPASLAAREKAASGAIDLESSGEFASVEKMLATTDANKFSTYLQTSAAEPAKRPETAPAATERTAATGVEERESRASEEGKPAAAMTVPQTKGKKNAYSNSVQKMTCPFCPRVFPWMSSLQRHMLTHTVHLQSNNTQKPLSSLTNRGRQRPKEQQQNSLRRHNQHVFLLLQAENTDDDDCHSNKSLDLNFGKKLIDFKLSTSSSSSQQPDYKHVCRVCTKSFRYAMTLARHERAHLSEEEQAAAVTEEEEGPLPAKEEESRAAEAEEKEAEMEEEDGGEREGESDGGESGESEEEKEKEERSDEEASEPKNNEGGRVDKRKKICTECGKRFWSLQDLTRHMRSHTGTLTPPPGYIGPAPMADRPHPQIR